MKILIVDEGRDRSAVASARALAGRGWTVGTASWRGPNLAGRSRAVSAWHYVAHTQGDEQDNERFLTTLSNVMREHHYETAVATWTAAIGLMSANRDTLGFPVGYGSHESVEIALDKTRVAEAAEKAGIGVPRVIPCDDASLVAYGRPVVVKSTTESSLPVKLCQTPEEAAARRDAIVAAGGQPIVQEILSEPLSAVAFVATPDGVTTYAEQRADLIWPAGAGVVARSVTVPADLGLRAAVERLVAATGFQGLGQLQFLRGAEGALRLIDFNPRYYGSIALAIAAGANQPDAWARLATGRPISRASDARAGVRFQWFLRDLRASLHARSTRDVLRAFTLAPRSVHSVWDPHDPLLLPRYGVSEVAGRLGRRAA